MSKPMVTKLFLGGMLAVVAGLVLMIGGVAGKPFEPDWEPLET